MAEKVRLMNFRTRRLNTFNRAIWHASDIGHFVFFECGRVPVKQDPVNKQWKQSGDWTGYAEIKPNNQTYPYTKVS